MPRWVILAVAALAAAAAAIAQERLDLLVGHGLATAPDPERSGFRVAAGGQTVLRVVPESGDRARLFVNDAEARVVALPPVPPLAVAPAGPPPAAPPPHFISTDFSTVADGLALWLADPPPATPLRWSATLRLTTDPGHVGNSRAAAAARGDRLPNRELDEQIERFFAANPLPPLAGGAGFCDVAVAATSAGPRPLLSIWIGEPYAADAAWIAPSSRGVLMQEPIGWPPAVRDAKNAAPAREAFAQDWRAAKTALLARLAAANGRPLYGAWRLATPGALAAARRALAAAPAGEAAPILYIGAWSLARERRFADAQQWMQQIALASPDAALAAEARWLTSAWGRRIGGDAGRRPSVSRAGSSLFGWQIWAAAPAEPTAPAALDDLRALQNALPREDGEFLLRAAVGRAADALAKAAAGLSAPDAAAAFASWAAANPLAADWALFDAGAALLAAGKPAVAREAFRALSGKYPQSPLARQAAWATIAAGFAAGDREAAKAAARQIVENPSSGADAPAARGDARSTPPAVAAPHAPTAAQWRARTLRWQRDVEFADFLGNGSAEAWTAAERAARIVADEAVDGDSRPDWLALGDILYAARRVPDAAQAYARAALDKNDDALRAVALARLAASLTPDARRVALALAGDKKLGPLLAPLRP